jgi:hypothetical protein
MTFARLSAALALVAAVVTAQSTNSSSSNTTAIANRISVANYAGLSCQPNGTIPSVLQFNGERRVGSRGDGTTGR